MLYKAERTPNAGRRPTGGQLALAKIRQPGRSEAEILEARRQVSALVDQGRPVPADLLVKGGFPAGLVKRAEAREQATRFEVLAKAATDRTIREGYEQLAAEAREQAESGD
jgi:hypothetical protein